MSRVLSPCVAASTPSWRSSSGRYAETPQVTRCVTFLRGDERRSYDDAVPEIRGSGCAAAHYRLRGTLERLCVRRLRGDLRLLLAFPEPDLAVGILIGRHNAAEDPYSDLCALLGVDRSPPPTGYAERNRPSCCDDDAQPPLLDEQGWALIESAIG